MSTVTKTEVKDEKSVVVDLPDYSNLWEVKKYEENDFWFMKVGEYFYFFFKSYWNLLLCIYFHPAEEAQEVLATEYYQPISERKPELCIVEVPSIVIVIETGFGYYTYPMLVIETRLNAEIRDWSSDVTFRD